MSSVEGQGSGRPNKPPPGPNLLVEQIAGSWNAMAGVWDAWLKATKSLSHERGDELGKSLTRIFDPEFWKTGGIAPFLEELQHVLSLPKLADVPTLELSIVQSSAAMLDLVRLFQQYMVVSIPMWVTASQRFQAEVAERAKRGEGLRSPGEVLDLWNDVLDRAMMEFNRSGEFARIQQQLLRASVKQRLEMRKIGERGARLFDLPARNEMTNLYRRMHEMQREIHKLRGEVRLAANSRNPASKDAGRHQRRSRNSNAK